MIASLVLLIDKNNFLFFQRNKYMSFKIPFSFLTHLSLNKFGSLVLLVIVFQESFNNLSMQFKNLKKQGQKINKIV